MNGLFHKHRSFIIKQDDPLIHLNMNKSDNKNDEMGTAKEEKTILIYAL